MHPVAFADPSAVAEALDAAGYLPDPGLATAAFLALRMRRPLFLEGDPGVGKTALAQALASITGSTLIRLQCYEGIDSAQALYDWDFPRQILHLRAAGEAADPIALEDSLYDRRFLVARPILQALETSPSTLLIDEIDRADDEFEAFLLETLAENSVTIPELGTITAETPPLVVITSNRTREVHDALKRRCLYHWVAHPDFAREVAIVRRRDPRGHRAAGERRRGGSRPVAAGQPAQAAGHRRDDRLDAGPARAGRVAALGRNRRTHPRGAAEVSRGHRPCAARPRRDARHVTWVCRRPAPCDSLRSGVVS